MSWRNRAVHLLYLFVLSLVPLLWFRADMVMVGHDNVFPLDPPGFLRDRIFTWSQHHGVGIDQAADLGGVTIHTIDAIPYLVGFSIQSTQKIVYVFWFFALLFSMYILAGVIQKYIFTRQTYLIYILPLLYTFNFYTLQAWWIGERTKFSLMVAFPIIFALTLLVYLKKRPVVGSAFIGAVVMSVFNGGGWKGLPLYGGMIVVLCSFLTYAMYSALVHKTEWRVWGKTVWFLCLSGIFFTLINAYSILPFLSHTLTQYQSEITRIGGATNTFGWIDMMSRDASIVNLLRLQAIPEWYTNVDHAYGQDFTHNPLLIAASYSIPILIVLSLLIRFRKGEHHAYFFYVFLLIVSLFFTAGSHEPLGFLYKGMVVHIPGFAIFRTPIYKFGYAYWFAASVLLSLTISTGISFLHTKIKFFLVPVIGIGATCVAVLFYHYPFLTGDIFRWNHDRLETRVAVPSYVYEANTWIEENNPVGRTLLIPPANANWQADVYQWKYFSLFPLMANVSRKPYIYNSDTVPGDAKEVLGGLYKAILDKNTTVIADLIHLFNINYLVVRNDFYWDLDWTITHDPARYITAIEENPQFVTVTRFGEWSVYKLKDYEAQSPVRVYPAAISYRDINDIAQVSLIREAMGEQTDEKSFGVYVRDVDRVKKRDIIDPLVTQKILGTICESCFALREQPDTAFPSLTILPNSPLYKLVELKRSRMPESIDPIGRLYDTLGKTLTTTQEIEGLHALPTEEGKKYVAISDTASRLTTQFRKLEDDIDTLILSNEKNIRLGNDLYVNLLAEEDKLTRIADASAGKPYMDRLNDAIYQLQHMTKKVSVFIASLDLYHTYRFYPDFEADTYTVALRYDSEKEAQKYAKLPLEVNNIVASSSSPVKNSVVYQDVSLTGDDTLTLNAEHENIVSDIIHVSYLHSTSEHECYGSVVPHIVKDDIYRIELTFINGFSNRLKLLVFPVEDIQEQPILTEPILEQYFERSDERLQHKEYVLAPTNDIGTVFIGLCTPILDRHTFDANTQKFAIYRIHNPRFIAYSQKNNSYTAPRISSVRINQTKYHITVSDAHDPFILMLDERYNGDWKVYATDSVAPNLGGNIDTLFEPTFRDTWFRKPEYDKQHIMVNGYANGWVIDRAGTYQLIVEYRPQQLFYQGAIVSILMIIALCVWSILRWRKQ